MARAAGSPTTWSAPATADGFARLHLACEQDPAITPVAERHITLRCAVLIAAKGGRLADITVGDVLELLDAEDRLKADVRSRPPLFKVLREMGVFGARRPGAGGRCGAVAS